MKNNIAISHLDMRQDDGYESFLESIQTCFESVTKENQPLFTTDATGLFDIFLDNLPPDARQHYTCHACRSFVEHYGSLVTLDESGDFNPAIWPLIVPAFFEKAIHQVRKTMERSKITGVFISDIDVLGTPVTGIWNHMAVKLPPAMVHKSKLQTAYQVMAEKQENFKMLIAALGKYHISVVEQAVNLLKTDSLYRSEKCLGIAEWFLSLHKNLLETKGSRRYTNLIWLAVATAPTGFCHISSSMIGTLLDDLTAGLPFDDVSRKFADKMHPLQYQRPQAAPTKGNIERAEEIVKKLGIAKSLERRYARIEEIPLLWSPRKADRKSDGEGVFSHLTPKGEKETPAMQLPTKAMTWCKFRDTVLPDALKIECNVPSHGNFSAILTAVYEDAEPILQWDSPDNRNPFSVYVYNGGSYAGRWSLSAGWREVTGICLHPSMWNGGNEHHGKSVIVILNGAKDREYKNCGNALFPETLKSELREVRSTIEAYSKKAVIGGFEEASACGLRLQDGSTWNAMLRITTAFGIAMYILDRWD